MDSPEKYQGLITEIVRKQMDILGPDMALQKARAVEGLKFDDNGMLITINGDPQVVLEALVNEYIALSGEIVKNILNPVFQKYPDIKLNLK